ncbi:hypothetical protein IE53DRAFT_114123 [Violaceomyces palustris]|uniref:Uncharacterized protein n=1 Tax=Violaceomyces palustris TaxID=1673888 RepID=A0ACD0NW55_9BASI|nr:hypothetical protein IE53DRAFT_114123 [Violaceomyces palustris]
MKLAAQTICISLAPSIQPLPAVTSSGVGRAKTAPQKKKKKEEEKKERCQVTPTVTIYARGGYHLQVVVPFFTFLSSSSFPFFPSFCFFHLISLQLLLQPRTDLYSTEEGGERTGRAMKKKRKGTTTWIGLRGDSP